MALRIDLKPFEQLIIGKAVLSNGAERAFFAISGTAPVLRVKDAIRPEDARQPLDKLQLILQRVYLQEADREEARLAIEALAREIAAAHPALREEVAAIVDLFGGGDDFKALKECRRIRAAQSSVCALSRGKRSTSADVQNADWVSGVRPRRLR